MVFYVLSGEVGVFFICIKGFLNFILELCFQKYILLSNQTLLIIQVFV